jgi:transcription elongation factor Elf1
MTTDLTCPVCHHKAEPAQVPTSTGPVQSINTAKCKHCGTAFPMNEQQNQEDWEDNQ